ncbi:MAG: hypothetical protein J6L69_09795 [Lachnospiraceae bacterium]|nr:hypothetical protein [Lachnospiraceae bacterium]
MAFSNEYLTEEEKKLIAETRHRILTSASETISYSLNDIATVDRDKKIWLLENNKTREWDYKERGYLFVIFWGKIHKDNVVEITLNLLADEFVDKSNSKYGVELIKYWGVKKIQISPKLSVSESEVKSILEEIMTAYGLWGNPEHNGPEFDGKVKAVVRVK